MHMESADRKVGTGSVLAVFADQKDFVRGADFVRGEHFAVAAPYRGRYASAPFAIICSSLSDLCQCE